jgi:hypothetical protein
MRLAAVVTIAWATLLVGVSPAHTVCNDDFIIGEDFRGTIYSAAVGQPQISDLARESNGPTHKIDTICAIFDELRGCWVPPSSSKQFKRGMEMTVRFAFKHNGEILATPRVTYATAGASSETRAIYLEAITAALDRCVPMHFTEDLASVVVGRPFAIRFVDDRPGLAQ